jgi:hypothetical protein
MKNIAVLTIIIFFITAGLFGEDIRFNFYFNPSYSLSKKTKIAVLNMECQPGWSTNADTNFTQTVEKKNIEKLEFAFLESGLTLVERSKLDNLIAEKKLSLVGLTESDSQKIGNFLNADIVVFGLIPAWSYYHANDTALIQIMIKAIDVNTGQIIFKAMFNHQFKTNGPNFRYEISKIEDKIYYDLFENELKKRIVD